MAYAGLFSTWLDLIKGSVKSFSVDGTTVTYTKNDDTTGTFSISSDYIPDGIIGVEYKNNAWHHINKNGQAVTPGATFFDNHPIWRDITKVTIDDCVMVKIPKFYFLYEQIINGHRWWVSKNAFTIDGVGTATVHKGFIYNGIIKDQFYVGAYECSTDPNDSSKAISASGVYPLVSINFSTMVTRCQNRNNGETVTGFDLWNIYQLAAIQMLCLIEAGNGNIQNVFGNGKAISSTDSVIWRNISDLWGNYWELVRGLDNRNGTYYAWADSGNSTFSTLNSSVPSSGYISKISSTSAELGLFLPSATSYSTSNCIFPDRAYMDNSITAAVCAHGGANDMTISEAGPFTYSLDHPSSFSSYTVSGRLAKV